MGLNDQEEKRRQAVEWLRHGTEAQKDAAIEHLNTLRPWCPEDCGCRLGPKLNGDHDADVRDCACDGPCTVYG